MKAWLLEKFGYDGINLKDVSKPNIGRGEILVKVLACGICYRDSIDIEGGFRYTGLPTVPGHEICGVVEEIGDGADEVPFSKGDIVISRHGEYCGRCDFCLSGKDNLCLRGHKFVHSMWGGYAEYVKAHWSAFEKVPPHISERFSPAELSVIFCAVGTAYRALVSQGDVRAGDTVLITGASGGVGIHVIQIAKSLSAYTIAVTTSESKVKKLKEIGADEVIISKDGRFNEDVMRITSGRGVDVVIENTGSVGLEGAIRSLKFGGTLVLVGNIKVDRYPLNPGMVITRELKLKGTVGISSYELKKLFNLLSQGKVKPIIFDTFPLQKMLEAHKIIKDKGVFGRIALVNS